MLYFFNFVGRGKLDQMLFSNKGASQVALFQSIVATLLKELFITSLQGFLVS